jgi:hypothetical protein
LDHSNNNELQNLYIISESREILEFLLFHLKEINKIAEYNKYKQILIERDLKYADREFMNIFPVFEKEND